MQGSPQVIEMLNEALTAELTAVNQYFIASKMAADWGYARLAKAYYDESIAEMRHAETLIERILFLEGVPNLQRLFSVQVGESVVEQFRANLDMEIAAVERYRRGVAICQEQGDPGTRTLLEGFLRDEEHHVDEGETELGNLEQLGEPLWLAKWV
ncbi:MAG TPA: bacterioferritin [Egibacteraceae bacterium]|jgi:bacterioferritin|nr:bacterioferritin [Egibacteraceae bacterium]